MQNNSHPIGLTGKSSPKHRPVMDWTPATLRREWYKFFEGKKHLKLPSASLLPAGDPTLLFTSAGMVPFKPYFEGSEDPPSGRVVTIQKCLRTTDLESVGKTARHLTFFEMLGNFSFGDYFKKEAVAMAYEFSTEVLKLDPEKIHITIYTDDDETKDLWMDIGVPEQRITRLGKEDNWWGPAGDSGPCGPCTELYLDRGPEKCAEEGGCGNPETCAPGNDCDRFMEYWNLVFNQYNQDREGNLAPLRSKGIDTGAGLERIVALLNGTESVYETSELIQLRERTKESILAMGLEAPSEDSSYHILSAYRVIADHARSASFAIGDGILPDNHGRGYVIRRMLRRACLFARELGVSAPLLYSLVPTIVDIYDEFYPELKKSADKIQKTLEDEEKRFLRTLDTGMKIWQQYLDEHQKKKAKTFSGSQAFRLYDTYGFPLEMTIELAEKAGMKVDLKEFEKEMEHQREMAQSASKWADVQLPSDLKLPTGHRTDFEGYHDFQRKSTVEALAEGDHTGTALKAPSKERCMVITKETCFYPEGGGQLGDKGWIRSDSGVFRVEDTRKKGDLILHLGRMETGEISEGQSVDMEIDEERRLALTRHHSATHLLNKSLRDILGDHILQTGSLVADNYLRFDFSHPNRISPEDLEKIEKQVNQAIASDAEVTTEVLPIEKAKESGALATFGEKYGEEVRVVSMGGGDLSIEFCGGCHVDRTGQIQYFHILKESSPGAGNRRIEAVAGPGVADYFKQEFHRLQLEKSNLEGALQGMKNLLSDNKSEEAAELSGEVESIKPEMEIPSASEIQSTLESAAGVLKLQSQLRTVDEELREKQKARLKLEKKINSQSVDLEAIVEKARASEQKRGKVRVFSLQEDGLDAQILRQAGDRLKESERDCVVLIGAKTEKGAMLVFMATKSAVDAGIDCGALIRNAAPVIGGKGGGKKDMAQAGGPDADSLADALKKADSEIESMMAASEAR
ncbi:MAG: alanine--tRNA ligase [Spirochaetaceae bacterium]|nr:alanine--tRNA ligase [Spirochaetaceae bacterium]